jgi:Glycosyl hydrolase family 59
MTEAKKRNNDIKLYALSWGVPGWIGNGSFFSQDNIDYHVKWLVGAKQVYGLGIK